MMLKIDMVFTCLCVRPCIRPLVHACILKFSEYVFNKQLGEKFHQIYHFGAFGDKTMNRLDFEVKRSNKGKVMTGINIAKKA